MAAMYKVGDVFSSTALKYCLGRAHYDNKNKTIFVDRTSLIPNPLLSEMKGRNEAVWNGSAKAGTADVRCIDEGRSQALWKITAVLFDSTGGGTSHTNHIQSQAWATYQYQASRINADGTPHDSTETLLFDRTYFVRDLELIST
jgi:hypothetical protein